MKRACFLFSFRRRIRLRASSRGNTDRVFGLFDLWGRRGLTRRPWRVLMEAGAGGREEGNSAGLLLLRMLLMLLGRYLRKKPVRHHEKTSAESKYTPMSNRKPYVINECGHEIPIDDISKLNKGDVFRMEPRDEFDPINRKQQWKAIRAPLRDFDGQWQIECQPYPQG